MNVRYLLWLEASMKRLLAFLLMLGVLGIANFSFADKEDDKDKDKKDKKDKDKDKKDKDKDKKDKDKGKKETKLTDAQKAELKKLAGTWSVISFEHDGKKAPHDERKKMKIMQK